MDSMADEVGDGEGDRDRAESTLEELTEAAKKIQKHWKNKKEADSSAAITVGVRMRPLVPHEKGQSVCFRLEDNMVFVEPQPGMEEKARKAGPWKFDFAMDSSDKTKADFVNNDRCYKLMGRRMVDQALNGFNTCLFCYGQTGTGKTTTIVGDPENGSGLLYRMLEDVFLECQRLRDAGATVELEVQMLEVYNGALCDLLIKKGAPPKQVDLRVLPSGVSVQGAEVRNVTSADECKRLIEYGQGNRHVAATQMNPQSSRGHTVFKLTIKKTGGADGTTLNSEIYFADLAGHENIKTTQVKGDQLKELTEINTSLMALTQALKAMASTKPGKKVEFHFFRSSKLTLLLSPALTGNSRTNVIITLSPALAHMDTTLDSLEIGKQAKSIKIVAKPQVSQDPKKVISELQKEVASLKKKLADAVKGKVSPEMAAQVTGEGPPSGDCEALIAEKQALEEENRRLKADRTEMKDTIEFYKQALAKQRRHSLEQISALTLAAKVKEGTIGEIVPPEILNNASTIDAHTLCEIESQVQRVNQMSTKSRDLIKQVLELIPDGEVEKPIESPPPSPRISPRSAGLLLVSMGRMGARPRLGGQSVVPGAH